MLAKGLNKCFLQITYKWRQRKCSGSPVTMEIQIVNIVGYPLTKENELSNVINLHDDSEKLMYSMAPWLTLYNMLGKGKTILLDDGYYHYLS